MPELDVQRHNEIYPRGTGACFRTDCSCRRNGYPLGICGVCRGTGTRDDGRHCTACNGTERGPAPELSVEQHNRSCPRGNGRCYEIDCSCRQAGYPYGVCGACRGTGIRDDGRNCPTCDNNRPYRRDGAVWPEGKPAARKYARWNEVVPRGDGRCAHTRGPRIPCVSACDGICGQCNGSGRDRLTGANCTQCASNVERWGRADLRHLLQDDDA